MAIRDSRGPRRKSARPAPAAARLQRSPRASPTRDALDVASYIAELAAQLEAMALAADLDLLAYLLGMARSEADLVCASAESADRWEDGQAAFDHEGYSDP